MYFFLNFRLLLLYQTEPYHGFTEFLTVTIINIIIIIIIFFLNYFGSNLKWP